MLKPEMPLPRTSRGHIAPRVEHTQHQLSNWSMQAVEAACEGEPGLWDKVAASGAFDTGLMDVTRLHLGF